jgi:hypothetical protein
MAFTNFGFDLEVLEGWKARARQLVRRTQDPAQSLQIMRDKAASIFDFGDLGVHTRMKSMEEGRMSPGQPNKDGLPAVRPEGNVRPFDPAQRDCARCRVHVNLQQQQQRTSVPTSLTLVEPAVFATGRVVRIGEKESMEGRSLVSRMDSMPPASDGLSVIGKEAIAEPVEQSPVEDKDLSTRQDNSLVLMDIESEQKGRQTEEFRRQLMYPILIFIFDPGNWLGEVLKIDVQVSLEEIEPIRYGEWMTNAKLIPQNSEQQAEQNADIFSSFWNPCRVMDRSVDRTVDWAAAHGPNAPRAP